MTDDETDDDTLNVRTAEEIAEANGVDVEVVEEGIEALAAEEAADRLPSAADFDAEFDDEEMTEREREVIEERIEELEDESRQYSTEEVAEDLGIDLDDDGNLEPIDALIDDLPDDGIGRYDPEEVAEINPDPDELADDED